MDKHSGSLQRRNEVGADLFWIDQAFRERDQASHRLAVLFRQRHRGLSALGQLRRRQSQREFALAPLRTSLLGRKVFEAFADHSSVGIALATGVTPVLVNRCGGFWVPECSSVRLGLHCQLAAATTGVQAAVAVALVAECHFYRVAVARQCRSTSKRNCAQSDDTRISGDPYSASGTFFVHRAIAAFDAIGFRSVGDTDFALALVAWDIGVLLAVLLVPRLNRANEQGGSQTTDSDPDLGGD